MTQNLPHKRISTKTLIESQSVDLTKTCWVAKTLLDVEFPNLQSSQNKPIHNKPTQNKPSHKTLAKTLSETETSTFCQSPGNAKTLSEVKLPDSKPIRTRLAKTMLDRRAIAEMVEKFELQKTERAKLAEATSTRSLDSHESDLIDKELEDKISADFSASDADSQTDNKREESFDPLLIVALILITLALVAFLALPADSSPTLVSSIDCHKA